MKSLDSLPGDIDQLFFKGKLISDDNLNVLLSNIGHLLKDRLAPREDKAPSIRMSKLGIPNRKLWFEHNLPLPLTVSSNALKFVYGDIIEQLIIFLAKEAGHTVEDEQKEVEIDGVKGHQDCKMDGVTIDVKSASSFSFRKFSERTIFKDDPFGYIAQLSAYSMAAGTPTSAFIGVNKENGQICVLNLDKVDQIDPKKRIAEVKEVVKLKEPPAEKCYPAVPYKTSNNLTLHKNCTYCPYAKMCWKDANNGQGLRYFQYASGPLALVSVVDSPRVEELIPSDAVGETDLNDGGEITTIGAN